MVQWREIEVRGRRLRISDRGEVQSLSPNFGWKTLYQGPNTWGYMRVRVRIDGKQRDFVVHKLVLEVFVGPRPEGQEARHLNDDKRDNCLSNLKWGTRSENERDKMRNGRGQPQGKDGKFISRRVA